MKSTQRIQRTVERKECNDIGADERIVVTEEFDFHGEHVERMTCFTPGDDGHVTVDQYVQGMADSVTLTDAVLDMIEEERQ